MVVETLQSTAAKSPSSVSKQKLNTNNISAAQPTDSNHFIQNTNTQNTPVCTFACCLRSASNDKRASAANSLELVLRANFLRAVSTVAGRLRAVDDFPLRGAEVTPPRFETDLVAARLARVLEVIFPLRRPGNAESPGLSSAAVFVSDSLCSPGSNSIMRMVAHSGTFSPFANLGSAILRIHVQEGVTGHLTSSLFNAIHFTLHTISRLASGSTEPRVFNASISPTDIALIAKKYVKPNIPLFVCGRLVKCVISAN